MTRSASCSASSGLVHAAATFAVDALPVLLLQGVKIADACEAAGVKAFPTWVINGATTEGQLELPALQAALDAAQGAGAAGQEAASVAAAAAGQ